MNICIYIIYIFIYTINEWWIFWDCTSYVALYSSWWFYGSKLKSQITTVHQIRPWCPCHGFSMPADRHTCSQRHRAQSTALAPWPLSTSKCLWIGTILSRLHSMGTPESHMLQLLCSLHPATFAHTPALALRVYLTIHFGLSQLLPALSEGASVQLPSWLAVCFHLCTLGWHGASYSNPVSCGSTYSMAGCWRKTPNQKSRNHVFIDQYSRDKGGPAFFPSANSDTYAKRYSIEDMDEYWIILTSKTTHI